MSKQESPSIRSRRSFLATATSAGMGLMAGSMASLLLASDQQGLPIPPVNESAQRLAQDEAFWREVSGYYERTEGVVNLEHGYWGKMAKPVLAEYQRATNLINTQNSYYARKQYNSDLMESTRRIAEALKVDKSEIVITRNATEAVHALLLQYQGLQPGDKVLFADIDYPSFKSTMRWLEQNRGVQAVSIGIPGRADQSQILSLYTRAFTDHPELKLALVTHASNQHGLRIPIARISNEARSRGIDIVCDCAQSWGLLDFTLPELNVDWAGFNLHKWLGAPVGVGALYMRRGSLAKVAPYPGESDPDNRIAARRIHSGTSNFAANLAIPAALDFHQAIGGANKEARLRYLRRLWTDEAAAMSHIEILGGNDEESWTGIGSFRLAGRNSAEDARRLQHSLEQDHGIFTVARYGLDSGACVRITPQVFTSADEIGQLVDALRRLESDS